MDLLYARVIIGLVTIEIRQLPAENAVLMAT
jgi:hypothetical protein